MLYWAKKPVSKYNAFRAAAISQLIDLENDWKLIGNYFDGW